MGWVLGLLACGGGEPTATSHGTLLHVGPDTVLVQHDDLRGRVVAGVERYRRDADTLVADAKPGDHVDLWLDGARLVKLRVTGHDGFVEGGQPVQGTVVNKDGIRVTVDHDPVPGLMGAMVMGFGLAPWEAEALAPGDRIEGALVRSPYGVQLVDPVKTGVSEAALRDDVRPLAPGEVLPRTELTAEDGSTIVLGKGQGIPTALTYIYTRCPDPAFCPAIGARMASLQESLKASRIVTVTIDPERDDIRALQGWGMAMGANFSVWRLARAEPVVLQELALRGGQHVTVDGGRISHLHRLLVLDADGALIERYDTADWPRDRVIAQLEGKPIGP